MRNTPDDIANQFINFIKKELKKLCKETNYATYDDYDYEKHDDLDVFWDRGRFDVASDVLSKIKKYEKMEDYTK